MFIRLPTATALLFAFAAEPALAQWAGVIERNQTTPSEALGGRDILYDVYRPSEAPRDGRRWPVIYLLDGRPSDSAWLDQGSVWELIDRATADGTIPPSLIVMPAAPYSWYVDNPDPGGSGMIATALTRDLVAAIDVRYPTAACREGRAVGGLSMGGYGAMLFAIDAPQDYVAAMSLAGSITPPIERNDRARAARADAFYDGAFGRPLSIERFNAWNLFTRLPNFTREAGPKPDFFIAIGDRDRGGLMQSAMRMHIELVRARLDSTLRVGAGGHDWPTWRRQFEEALPWLGPKLDPSCSHQVAQKGESPALAAEPEPEPPVKTP